MNAAITDDYMVRFFDRNGVNERWFPTRDARTQFVVLELNGKYLGWEDPARDCNHGNIYIKGTDIR